MKMFSLHTAVPRFFRSLYWKLSLTFLALLVVLAIAYIYITAITAETVNTDSAVESTALHEVSTSSTL